MENIYQYLAGRINLAFKEYARTKRANMNNKAKIEAEKKKNEIIRKIEKVVLFSRDLGLDLENCFEAQLLRDLSADFEKVSEDLYRAASLPEDTRKEALKHVLKWLDINAPRLTALLEVEVTKQKEE